MSEDNITQWNPICKIGDDFIRYLQVMDPVTKLPVADYTDWQFFAGIRASADADDYIHQMTLGEGFSVVDVEGEPFIKLKIPRAITGAIDIDTTPRPGGAFPEKRCLIDVVIQDAAGDQVTGLEGKITFRWRSTA